MSGAVNLATPDRIIAQEREASRRPLTAPDRASSRSNVSAEIEISSVGKTYEARTGEVAALSDVSLRIASGSFVSVVGRSGCGKSTLLRLLAGLIRPTTGTVRISGRAVDGPPREARYVFQDYGQSLLPWKTVGENVRFGLAHAYRPDADRDFATAAEEHLAMVGLAGVSSRYPWELSGGMQQRVAIARAVSARPSVLLMDEPFSSIDALSRAQLQDMLLTLWARLNITIVCVTHDIEEAIYLSDRVIVLAPDGAGVAADVAIELPRPRSQVETRELDAYLHYRRQLLRLVLD